MSPFDDFPADGKRHGYKTDGSRHNVDPDRHLMHRFGNTPCLDAEVVKWWLRHGIKKVRVYLTTGLIYECDLEHFYNTREQFEHVTYGPQYAAPRAWVAIDPEQCTLF